MIMMTQSHKNADNRLLRYTEKVKHDWIARYQQLIGGNVLCEMAKYEFTSGATTKKIIWNNKRADRAKQQEKKL